MKWKLLCILILIVLSSTIFFVVGRMTAPKEEKVNYVDFSGFQELIDQEEDFILYVGRSSCKICAIVYGSIHKFVGHGADIYVLNLEELRGTDIYNKIKGELGFYYMPCFKAFQDGKEIAHLNNPLSDSYFESGADYKSLLEEMENNVISFIDGFTGKGPFVTEEPMATTITATPVEKED